MPTDMLIRRLLPLAAGALGALVPAASHGAGEDQGAHGVHIERQDWTFGGFGGQFEAAQLQRGFQIYKDVCVACHGLKRVYFRNLAQPGGPEFPEQAVKALAADWPNKVVDGPDDSGKMFERPAKLFDPILGPFRNDQEARAAQNGALPPDLSVIAKARNPDYTGPFWAHPFSMLRDVATGYQEGGANYIVVIAATPAYPGHVRQLIHAACTQEPLGAKWIIVVDGDVNPHDWEEVTWCLWSRAQPQRDLFTTSDREVGNYLDPSVDPARRGYTSKVGIDATTAFKGFDFPPLAEPSAALKERVLRRWPEYGLP